MATAFAQPFPESVSTPDVVMSITERADVAAGIMRSFVGPAGISGGVVAVGDGRSPPVFRPVGALDREGGPEVAVDSLFRLYCMSKPLTGLAVLRLVHEGRLSLDESVADHLPMFAQPLVHTEDGPVPAARPILVRDLLMHTSGITMPLVNRGPIPDLYIAAGLLAPRVEVKHLVSLVRSLPRDRDDYLERLSGIPLVSHPGTRYEYGLSYDLLGFLVEKVTGERFEDHLRDRVLRPLGMNDTMFVIPPDDLRRTASSYYFIDGRLERTELPGTSIYMRDPAWLDAGNGMVSSAGDYARFLDAVVAPGRHSGGIPVEALAALSVDGLPLEMTTGKVGERGGGAVGGYVVREGGPGRPNPGTYGWSGIGGTYFWADPVDGYWITLMMQYGPAAALPIRKRILKAFYP